MHFPWRKWKTDHKSDAGHEQGCHTTTSATGTRLQDASVPPMVSVGQDCNPGLRGQHHHPLGPGTRGHHMGSLEDSALRQRGLFWTWNSKGISPAKFWTCLGLDSLSFLPLKMRMSFLCLSHYNISWAHNLSSFTGSQLERNFTSEWITHPDSVTAKKSILEISSFLQWASGKPVKALPWRNALSLLYLTTKKHVICSRKKMLSLSHKAVAIPTTGKRQSWENSEYLCLQEVQKWETHGKFSLNNN